MNNKYNTLNINKRIKLVCKKNCSLSQLNTKENIKKRPIVQYFYMYCIKTVNYNAS